MRQRVSPWTERTGCTRTIALSALLACAIGCSAERTREDPRRAPPTTIAAAGKSGAPMTFDNPMVQAPAAPASDTGAAPTDACARGMRTTSRVTPTVWLVIDGSRSMTLAYEANRSRWDVLRSVLVDPGGVIDNLQGRVDFGLVVYSDSEQAGSNCLAFVTVMPAANNLASIAARYPTEPIGMGTPTDKALEHLLTMVPASAQQPPAPDTRTGPVYVVLATDGEPNGCAGFDGGSEAEQRVLSATTRCTQSDVQMYIVSLAGGDAKLEQHLDRVAMATASKTPPFVPATQAALVMAIGQIANGASCLIALDGMVKPDSECLGNVQLDGIQLPCNQADGWHLADPRTVQLTGSACDEFLRNGSMVTARFGCDAFRPD